MYASKIILRYIQNLKFNFFFLILSSFLASVFNALSVVSLIPIVSLILESRIDPKITNMLNQFIDFDFNQFCVKRTTARIRRLSGGDQFCEYSKKGSGSLV